MKNIKKNLHHKNYWFLQEEQERYFKIAVNSKISLNAQYFSF
jgi:hypothetical protein